MKLSREDEKGQLNSVYSVSCNSQFLLISKEQYLKGWLFWYLLATLRIITFPHMWLNSQCKAPIFIGERYPSKGRTSKYSNLNFPVISFSLRISCRMESDPTVRSGQCFSRLGCSKCCVSWSTQLRGRE